MPRKSPYKRYPTPKHYEPVPRFHRAYSRGSQAPPRGGRTPAQQRLVQGTPAHNILEQHKHEEVPAPATVEVGVQTELHIATDIEYVIKEGILQMASTQTKDTAVVESLLDLSLTEEITDYT